MQSRLKMSREGLELLKSFEGLRLTAAQLSDGRWTMGHGHTQYAREGAVITEADAEALLLYDLIPVQAAVNEAVTVEISQNQFDALVCFAFNVGADAFRESEVLTRVNQERMTEAALAMAIWRAGAFDGRRIVLDALVRRRSAEEALMLGRTAPPSPSDLVRPEVDPVAEAALPASQPADLQVDFAAPAAEVAVTEHPAPEEPQPIQSEPAPEPANETVAPDVAPVEPTPDVAPEPEAAEVEALAPEISEPAPVDVAVSEPDASEPAVEPVEEPVAAEALVADPAPVEPAAEPTPGDAAPADAPAEQTVVLEATVSTRIYATYPLDAFAPVTAAEPVQDEAEPLDLASDIVPAVSSDLSEPPLVLVLSPPPEVIEPAPSRTAGYEAAPEPSEGQAALFEETPAAPVEDGGVIFYEPLAEAPSGLSRWSDATALVMTGAVGLSAFGFGVAGFHLANENPVPAGMFDEKSAIAWVLVGIGTIFVGITAYNLFKRFGIDDAE